jgi:uncharacterized protein
LTRHTAARFVDTADDELQRILQEIVRRLRADLNLQQLFVFGSRVSGATDEESDLDLLIIAPSSDRPLERRSRVRRLLADFDQRLGLDILFYTPEEADMFADEPASFLYGIMKTGFKVYDEKTL